MDDFKIQSVHRVKNDNPEVGFELGNYEVDTESRYIATSIPRASGEQSQIIQAVDVSNDEHVCVYIPKVSIQDPKHILLQDLSQGLPKQARDMAKLQHPNILRVLDWCYVNGFPALVTEWLEGDRLDVYKFQDVFELSDCIMQMANGIDYLHSHNIFHMDISASNTMVVNRIPVLCDFGSSSINPWGESALPFDFVSLLDSNKVFDLRRFSFLTMDICFRVKMMDENFVYSQYPSSFNDTKNINGMRSDMLVNLHRYFEWELDNLLDIRSAKEIALYLKTILLSR